MKSLFQIRFVAAVVLAATIFPAVGIAADFMLSAGDSVTLSETAAYDKMIINGNLTVSGGVTIETTTVVMTNGLIIVTGNGTALGSGKSNSALPTTWSMYPDENGIYGKIMAVDVNASGNGLGANVLNLCVENEAVQSATGFIDFLALENGSMNLRTANNQSSLTGRVTVADSGGTLYRLGARQRQPMFASGTWALQMEDNANLVLNFGNQGGFLNNDGVSVGFNGNADVSIVGGYSESYPVALNPGARFNHNGSLSFSRSGNAVCVFRINGSEVIGANVTNVSHTGNASAENESRIQIAEGVTATVRNVEFTGNHVYLTGPGTLKVDTTVSDCTFKSNIKSGDSVVVEKVGMNEMVVSSTTNIPRLVVNAGTVRFVADCMIESISAVKNTALIADGCNVTLLSDSELVNMTLETANGGTFISAGTSRTVIYDPVSVSGSLHVASGELAFSRYGLLNKYWRFTFRGVVNGPQAPVIGKLWLFGTDGSQVGNGIGNTTANTTPATGKACWTYDSGYTNIAMSSAARTDGRHNINTKIGNLFNGNLTDKKDNFPYLGAPQVNPEDAMSWVSLSMQLKGDESPVTGYNMGMPLDKCYPTSWKVEVSDDYSTWTTVDDRVGVSPVTVGAYYFYDGMTYGDAAVSGPNEFFRFTDYRRGGLDPLCEALSVQVDAGATIDLLAFDAGQPINAIAIDLSSGGGTIKGGKITTNGTLTLTNVAASGADVTSPLPLVFDGTIDAENFTTWTVVIDGKTSRRHPIYGDGRIVVPCVGFVLGIR